MADEDDRHVAVAQLPHGLEQVVDLVRRQRRGRLVHDEQPRTRRERLCDLEDLPVGDSQPAHRDTRIEVDAELAEQAGCFGSHPPPVHSADSPKWLPAREDVLGCRQIREDGRLLIHRDDAEPMCCLRVSDSLSDPADRNLAIVGLDDSCEQLHDRRLAGAVLADERMDGAALDHETHVRDSLDTAVALAELAKLDERRRLRGHQRVYPAGTPPSTLMMLPVDFALRGPARYAMASATSSG